MSIFTKPAAEPVASNGLPDGYEDTGNLFFVPPADRPYYAGAFAKAKQQFKREKGAAAMMARSYAQDFAYAAATEARGPRPQTASEIERRFLSDDVLRGPVAEADRQAAAWDQHVADWLDENATEFDAPRIAFHMMQLKLAQHARGQAENRERVESEIRARNTCPQCGECDRAANGPVVRRDLIDPDSNDNNALAPFTSCVACFMVKRQAIVDAWSSARVTTGLTRRDLLAAEMPAELTTK